MVNPGILTKQNICTYFLFFFILTEYFQETTTGFFQSKSVDTPGDLQTTGTYKHYFFVYEHMLIWGKKEGPLTFLTPKRDLLR